MLRILILASAICYSLSVSMSVTAHAQSAAVLRLCIADYFKKKAVQKDQASAFGPDEASLLVSQIIGRVALRSADISDSIVVIPCDEAKNAVAYYEKDPQQGIPTSKNYILYAPTWVKLVVGKDREMAVFLFGHELGHIINGHTTWGAGADRLPQETRADEFAGCALAKMNISWSARLEDLIWKTRPHTDTSYPSERNSIAIAKKGFSDCGGKNDGTEAFKDLRIIYQSNNLDRGNVINALSALDAGYSIQPGSAQFPSNTLVCSTDVPISLFRNFATALLKQGVPIRRIRMAKGSEDRNQLSIVADYDTDLPHLQPVLTPDQIEKISSCANAELRVRALQTAARTSKQIAFVNECDADIILSFMYVASKNQEWTQTLHRFVSKGRIYRPEDTVTSDERVYVYANGREYKEEYIAGARTDPSFNFGVRATPGSTPYRSNFKRLIANIVGDFAILRLCT